MENQIKSDEEIRLRDLREKKEENIKVLNDRVHELQIEKQKRERVTDLRN